MSEFNNQMQLKIPEKLMKPRFVSKSGLSKADAKRICEDNGVIWDVE